MSGPLPRMGWALLLALSSLIAGGMQSCVSTARADPLPLVRGVGCIGLTVSDADRSVDFYGRVLGFAKVADVVSDMDRAYAALRAARVEHASTGPQRLPDWNPNAGGIRAFYFRDPDRHVLEVLQFPAGKGDARWHAAAGLFLGIDHTAIVVGDTAESLRFYRAALGLRVAGTSENWVRSRSISTTSSALACASRLSAADRVPASSCSSISRLTM